MRRRRQLLPQFDVSETEIWSMLRSMLDKGVSGLSKRFEELSRPFSFTETTKDNTGRQPTTFP
jgi:hypothetical protein